MLFLHIEYISSMSTIEITAPQSSGYTIYSKNNCPYSTKAKQLLTAAHIVECDVFLTAEKKPEFLRQMDAFTGLQYRTFPMVFYDGEFVGGFTEAKVHFEKQVCFAEDEF